MPTSAAHALDIDALVDGCRAALLANSVITTALDTAHFPKRIASELIAEGVTRPAIVLSIASAVYESTYQGPTVSVLMDVSCYTDGESTTTVRALMKACLTALIDTPWTATGLLIQSANMEESGAGFRQITEVTNGIITRGRQATIRIRAAVAQ